MTGDISCPGGKKMYLLPSCTSFHRLAHSQCSIQVLPWILLQVVVSNPGYVVYISMMHTYWQEMRAIPCSKLTMLLECIWSLRNIIIKYWSLLIICTPNNYIHCISSMTQLLEMKAQLQVSPTNSQCLGLLVRLWPDQNYFL